MRSAKQRANDRRLGRMAKSRASKRVKRTTTRRKTMRRRSRRAPTRRRAYSTVRRTFSRRSGSKIISTVKPMATGIGGGLLAETVANRVGMGQYGQIAGYGGAYAVAGFKGVIGKLGFDLLSGRGIGFGIGSGQSSGGLSV